MCEAVVAGDRLVEELRAAQERQACFEPLELAGIADAQHVPQDFGARVDVRVVVHMCRDANSGLSGGAPPWSFQ